MSKNAKLALVFFCVAAAFYFDMRHRMGDLSAGRDGPPAVEAMPYAANTPVLKVHASR